MNELNSWKTNNVYEQIPYNHEILVHVKLVCTMKETNDQQMPKTRLVVKGFEETAKDEILKDSPTCSKENLQLVLSVIVQKKWKMSSTDIKIEFLHRGNIDKEPYLLPPKEANTDKIWLLKKCTYGLIGLSKQWYHTVKQVLLSLGFKTSKANRS